MQSIIQAENISKRFGEKLLFDNIFVNINEGEKAAIVGLNGTGKTTLLKILAGYENFSEGKISTANDIQIAYLPQYPELNENNTVLEAVFNSDTERVKLIKEYRNAIESQNLELIQKTNEAMDCLQLWDYEYIAKQILTKLSITNFNSKIKTLSGGQKKRVALAAVLIDEADLLILDEPTNHLDLDMIEWLEDYLFQTKSAVLMVTHDRYFLERICNKIIEIDEQTLFTYEGNFSAYLEKRSIRKENLMQSADKAKNLMRTELEWIRRMPKARTHKPKYRIDAFYDLKKAAQNITVDPELRIPVKSERLGKKVLEIENLSMSYGNLSLIKDYSLKINPGEKIGIIGKNGSGKTTFLNLITENITPDKGEIIWGETVKYAYYKQDGISFNDDDKPIDIIKALSENISLSNGKNVSASGFLQLFLFPPALQHAYIKKLSGGEKRRLYLCSILVQRPNVLILDEPTNDLDILTLQVLEQYLYDFSGSVIIVSHDRYFMDKIVDHIFVFEGNGKIKDFPGNYTVYRTQYETPDINKSQPKEKVIKKGTSENITKKLSFRDKYEMEQLDKELIRLNNEKSELELMLNSGNLNNNEIQEISQKFADLLKLIDTKELRWLELSDKAEN
ncbi:MAG: ABC-F family ATP-binding cassette domain-containing protein [Bacteroidales bacterium]|jgi:ATP-binding cassette subfamily F protein uup|nr:ABC-F family ATP-binding cassette domain-containing protein [Bacteroidales bacterium]